MRQLYLGLTLSIFAGMAHAGQFVVLGKYTTEVHRYKHKPWTKQCQFNDITETQPERNFTSLVGDYVTDSIFDLNSGTGGEYQIGARNWTNSEGELLGFIFEVRSISTDPESEFDDQTQRVYVRKDAKEFPAYVEAVFVPAIWHDYTAEDRCISKLVVKFKNLTIIPAQ